MRRYHLTAESIRFRDGWLVEQLLALVETLLSRLETGERLMPEEQVAVADLRVLAAEAGMVARPPLKALPWMMRVERVVFGHWLGRDNRWDGALHLLWFDARGAQEQEIPLEEVL